MCRSARPWMCRIMVTRRPFVTKCFAMTINFRCLSATLLRILSFFLFWEKMRFFFHDFLTKITLFCDLYYKTSVFLRCFDKIHVFMRSVEEICAFLRSFNKICAFFWYLLVKFAFFQSFGEIYVYFFDPLSKLEFFSDSLIKCVFFHDLLAKFACFLDYFTKFAGFFCFFSNLWLKLPFCDFFLLSIYKINFWRLFFVILDNNPWYYFYVRIFGKVGTETLL